MPNLRIVTKNALRQASLTASSTAGNLAVSSLAAAVKSSLHRFTGTNGSYRATWAAPARIGCAALPFCNWSPTAKMCVRVSAELGMTNLATYSEDMGNTTSWARAAMTTVTINNTAAPNGANTADRVIPNATLGSHYLDKSISGLPDNTVYAGSVFFKRDTLWRAMLSLTAKDGSGTTLEVNFEDGRLSRMSNGSAQNCEFKLWDIGNGWYRLGIEKWNTLSGATVPRLRLFASQHNEISTNGWSNTAVVTTRAAGQTSPYANWPVDSIIEDTTATTSHYTATNINTEIDKAMLLEVTLKPLGAGATRYGVVLLAAGSGLAANRYAIVNLTTGAITAKVEGTECAFSTENMGNGYWRVKCLLTPKLKGIVNWQVRLSNSTTNAAPTYTGDGVSGMLACKPYVSLVVPDNTWAPFTGGSEASVVGDTTTGFFAWGAQLELGQRVTSYYPTTTTAQTRPVGYIDAWQSYDYDSGWVLACPAPAVELEGFTAAQAASAYAYGGGAYARHWLPQQMDATGLAVDIADPDNLQGYIEAACMVAGPVWSPRYNASGTSVSVIDRTEVSRSAAGDQLADPGTLSRKVPVDLRAMPEEDRARFLDLVRNSRAHPILMSVFPEHPDLALERDFMVYGRRTKDSDIAYQFAGAYSTTLEIEEI
ncbi:MAG TPA: hypothetical protein DDZ22_11520 [Massilia sp.]|nr:hypothetical protein [Massilia sp.]